MLGVRQGEKVYETLVYNAEDWVGLLGEKKLLLLYVWYILARWKS